MKTYSRSSVLDYWIITFKYSSIRPLLGLKVLRRNRNSFFNFSLPRTLHHFLSQQSILYEVSHTSFVGVHLTYKPAFGEQLNISPGCICKRQFLLRPVWFSCCLFRKKTAKPQRSRSSSFFVSESWPSAANYLSG